MTKEQPWGKPPIKPEKDECLSRVLDLEMDITDEWDYELPNDDPIYYSLVPLWERE